MADQKPVVGIIMGSKSDLGVMEGCTAELEALGVPYELVIASAHRTTPPSHCVDIRGARAWIPKDLPR